ncbi:MAG: sensor histidine kinase [Solirubrobacteraceae bacterium]
MSAVWHGVLIIVLTFMSVGLVGGAMRRSRPAGIVWPLLRAAVVLNAVCTVAWWWPVLAGGGTALGQPSVADAGWLVANLLLAVAIVVALSRREAPLLVALDVATIAVGVGVVVGIVLVGPDLAASLVPMKVRVTQACYVVCDVILFSAAARLALAPRPRPFATWLLAGAALSVVFSDVAWNWLTISGTYVPGSWGDVGWVLRPVLLSLAALHPSMRRLGTRESRRDTSLHVAGPVLLGAAALISPLMLGLHRVMPSFPDIADSLPAVLAVTIAGAALAALAVLRFLVLLRQARSLAAALGDALDQRGRMLELSQSRYRQLVEQIPGAIYVIALGENGQPARPLYVTPQIEGLIGLSVQQWMRGFDRLLESVHPDDRARVAAIVEGPADGRQPEPAEYRCIKPSGEEVWVRDACAVVTADGDRRLLQGLLFDITAAKRSEADRDRLELDLRLGQKLEAVGQLAAGIAHEINTPTQFVGDTVRFLDEAFGEVMQLVVAYERLLVAAEAGPVPDELIAAVREAEELADLDYLRERVPGAFERATDGVHRVATIVRAMREFAHPPTTDKVSFDINQALRSTLVVASNEYRYIAEVQTDFAELPPVMCDGGDINQVFLNLVVNAAHAIEDVTAEGERGTITLRTTAEDDHVHISVSDTGPGIPSAVAGRIYDPFFTTKDVGRGTGQGLAIARRIVVERHGGTLSFETEQGRGTTFHVRLPVGQQVAVPRATPVAA